MSKKCIIALMIILFLFQIALTGCNQNTPSSTDSLSSLSDDYSEMQSESSIVSDAQTETGSNDSDNETSVKISGDFSSHDQTTQEPSVTVTPIVSSPTPKPSLSPTPAPTVTPKPSVKYYLAGSWNGYLVNDENYIMQPLDNNPGFFTVTVELTQSNRDAMYDGHWYKVTEGNWNKSYGIDNYAVQPAPVKYIGDAAIGLGSVWIDNNMILTVYFDSVDKIIYDTTMDDSILPK